MFGPLLRLQRPVPLRPWKKAALYSPVSDRLPYLTVPYLTVPSLTPPHLSVLDLDRNFLEIERGVAEDGETGQRRAEGVFTLGTQRYSFLVVLGGEGGGGGFFRASITRCAWSCLDVLNLPTR